MAVSGPQNQGIPGYAPYKPPKPPSPYKPPGPGGAFAGLGVEGSGAATANSGAAPAGYNPAGAAPAPAAAAPVDYWAASKLDPQYMTGDADLQASNTANLASLLKGYLGQAQGYQDNANAHNMLFSGQAVHAQNYAAQNYADQQAAQARALLSGEHNLQTSVFNRMLTSLSGISPTPTITP